MTRRLLVPILVLVGLVFLGVGSQWNRLRPASAYWSDEQAAEYTAAHVALHSLSHHHNNDHDGSHAKEVAAARARYDQVNRQLERAQNSRDRTGTILNWLGIVCVLSGIVIHFADRSKTS